MKNLISLLLLSFILYLPSCNDGKFTYEYEGKKFRSNDSSISVYKTHVKWDGKGYLFTHFYKIPLLSYNPPSACQGSGHPAKGMDTNKFRWIAAKCHGSSWQSWYIKGYESPNSIFMTEKRLSSDNKMLKQAPVYTLTEIVLRPIK